MPDKQNHERQIIAELNQQKQQGLSGSAPAGTGFAPRQGMSRVLRVQDSLKDTAPEPKPEPQPEVKQSAPESKPAVEPEQKQAVDTPTPSPAAQSSADTTAVLQQLLEQVQGLAQSNAELKQKLEASESEAAEKQTQAQLFEDLSKLVGKGADQIKMPGVNTLLKSGRDQVDGLIAEALQVRDSCNPVYRRSEKFRTTVPAYNARGLDYWMSQQTRTMKGRRAMLMEMDGWAKSHGLLQGNKVTKDATTGADVPGGFLEVLSSFMRVSNRPGYIFWQFPTTVHEFERGRGEVVQVPRSKFPDRPQDINDRLLSGSGSYVGIDPGNAPVQTGVEEFVLKEYGLGRPDAPPIGIPMFVGYNSMIDLYRILEVNLAYDYHAWEDLACRGPLQQASTVLYNNNGALATSAAAITAGGQMSRRFLSEIYTQMAIDETVPFLENSYALTLNTIARNQLKQDLDTDWEAPTPEELERFTNMMAAQYPTQENYQISGYLGHIENFHIFSSNSFATGTAASDPLVEVETTTAAAETNATFRESFAFGGGALGRAIGGTGMQVVFGGDPTGFGRVERAIWHSYEAHGPLDVDPTLSDPEAEVPQERRVWRLRTSDVPLTLDS